MLNERKLTDKELEKREDIIQALKKNKRSLVKKYGKDAEKVMYGIATKQAKSKVEEMNKEKLRGMIEDALKNPKLADLNKDGKLSSYEKKRGAAIEKNVKEGFYSTPSDMDESGLNVIPRDQVHANKLNDALDTSGLYAEWNTREGYFFFPEQEENYDVLEQQIQDLLDEYNIQASIEGIFQESLEEGKGTTLTLSQSDMDKLHKDGKLTINGHSIIYKTTMSEEDNREDDELSPEELTNKHAGSPFFGLEERVNKIDAMLNESLSPSQKEAIGDLQNILYQLDELGNKARQIVASEFPEELSGAEAYDVFEFGSSSNQYDKTLATLIDGIIRRFEEEEDELNEGAKEAKLKHDVKVKAIKIIKDTLKKEGGAAGLEPLVKAVKGLGINKNDLVKLLKNTVKVEKHTEGDYILTPINENK